MDSLNMKKFGSFFGPRLGDIITHTFEVGDRVRYIGLDKTIRSTSETWKVVEIYKGELLKLSSGKAIALIKASDLRFIMRILR